MLWGPVQCNVDMGSRPVLCPPGRCFLLHGGKWDSGTSEGFLENAHSRCDTFNPTISTQSQQKLVRVSLKSVVQRLPTQSLQGPGRWNKANQSGAVWGPCRSKRPCPVQSGVATFWPQLCESRSQSASGLVPKGQTFCEIRPSAVDFWGFPDTLPVGRSASAPVWPADRNAPSPWRTPRLRLRQKRLLEDSVPLPVATPPMAVSCELQ